MKRLLICVAAFAAVGASTGSVAQSTATEDIIALETDRAQRMTVPVSIGGKGPYQFIVDTGSERTVLSDELAGTLGLDPSGTAEVHSVTGIGTVDTVDVASLSISAIPILNLTTPILKRRNLGAAGILGIDTLQAHRVLLDFKAKTMTVSPSTRAPEPRADDDGETIVIRAKNRLGRLILVDAAVGGRKVAIVIDTGAEHSIGNAALRKRVIGRNRDAFVVPTSIFSVTGGSVPAEITMVKEMRIGSLTLTDMPIAFADLQIFKQLGLDRKPAMLLGMNTLRAFDRVSVDFANRKVRFVVPGESRLDDATQTALVAE